MAKVKVVLQDAAVLLQCAEQQCREYEQNEMEVMPDTLDALLEQLGQELEALDGVPLFQNTRKQLYVLAFCKIIMLTMKGENVTVSYRLNDGFYGEMASVSVVGKSINLGDLMGIRMFGHSVYSIDISDRTDGKVELVFGFDGMLFTMNGGNK